MGDRGNRDDSQHLSVTVCDQDEAGFPVYPHRQALPHLLYGVVRVPKFGQQRRHLLGVAGLSLADSGPCLRVHCRPLGCLSLDERADCLVD